MHARRINPYFEKLDELCRRVEGFSKLPRGWDGEEALPPPPELLGATCNLLRELPGGADLPAVSPAPEGEIGLTWINGPKQLNAILHADYHLVWVKRTEPGGRFMPGAEIDLSVERYPHQFMQEVAALYR